MKIILTIILFVTGFSVSGQIKKSDLIGDWTADNNDSLYFKSDTVTLYNDINFRYGVKGCQFIEWKVTDGKFEFTLLNNCTEPGRMTGFAGQQKLNLKSKNEKQSLDLIRGNKRIERFEVIDFKDKRVDRYPWDIKILKLRRL